MKQSTIITIIIAVIIGIGAFYAGMQYQKTHVLTDRGQFGFNRVGSFGQFSRGSQNNASRPVRGQIISSDQNSITIKLPNGSSKIILLSGNTSISEATAAAKVALQNGKQVVVFGTNNSDGSVTASNIQINPSFRGIGG